MFGLRRLRRSLVEDLLTGTDPGHVDERARALGHDLSRRHQVVLAQDGARSQEGVLDDAVARAAAALDMGALLGRRSGIVVLLADRPAPPMATSSWDELHGAVRRELPSLTVSMGIGGDCHGPADVPRSWERAVRALVIRRSSLAPDGVTMYDPSGALGSADLAPYDVEMFVRGRLGPLLVYDADHDTELVHTLAAYLAVDGNHEQAAIRLSVHRSTLRYRLWRVRELAGIELDDTETQTGLRVALWVLGSTGEL